MVTGGQRSGKSRFAESKVLAVSERPIYIATAEVRDEEFRERVARHQAWRGDRWTTIEEPIALGSVDVEGRAVLVDCVTMWATNHFFKYGENVDSALEALKCEFDKLTSQNATIVFVTNEIGLGGTSANVMQRKFMDLQGFINQYIAAHADEVYLLVSGIGVRIK
jgi:adenosylcobinamide kinase/adenosylcobinamide-phosphate guanylyltransferase